MYKKILSKKFFDNNFINEFNAQRLVYSEILNPEVVKLAANISNGIINRASEETKAIQEENNIEVLLKLLRGKCDPLNYELLEEKVLEKEEEMLPKIIDMVVKSRNDVFIEHVAKILPKCKKNYSENLLNILNNIRNPYALSLICISLGFIGDEEVIPIILNKYLELKKLYVDETYNQGPLLALYELKERLYK